MQRLLKTSFRLVLFFYQPCYHEGMSIGASAERGGDQTPGLPWQEHIDTLLGAPGLDPLSALAEGREDEIPREGYLITATAIPDGRHGSVEVLRYGNGALVFSSLRDAREEYGSISAAISLQREAETTLLIGKDEPIAGRYSAANREMMADTAEVESLEDGVGIIRQVQPRVSTGSLFAKVRNKNPYAGRYPTTDRYPIELCRVATSTEEVIAILGHLGEGMGLDDEQRQKFLAASSNSVGTLPRRESVVSETASGFQDYFLHCISRILDTLKR
jgi:hypothetical protein